MSRPVADSGVTCRKCGREMLRIGSRWTDRNGESICMRGGLHRV